MMVTVSASVVGVVFEVMMCSCSVMNPRCVGSFTQKGTPDAGRQEHGPWASLQD